jgi:NADH-quinone oxidoreductase subunit M
MQNQLLTTLTLVMPVIGILPIAFLTRGKEGRIKWYALIFSLLTLGMSLLMLASFDYRNPDLQLAHLVEWFTIGNYKISYYVGVDGLSILLVVLTGFIMPLAILFSLNHVQKRVRLYYSFLLLLEFAMIGVFVAQDLFLFYVFWEVSLVPMYFIVGIWGSEQRIYAAVKFFLYTMAGSILMLLAILFMGNHFRTFNVQEIMAAVQAGGSAAYPAGATQLLLFLGFFIAFAIKVPIWPLHSWLPDAHVQAPTAGSVILAGVLLKLGTYGLVRFNLGFFPEVAVQAAPFIGLLAVIGIIYGAWVSYAQTDIKKLVAYSSISHLGFVVLGIFALNAAGISGATLQMINHGISTGGLFLMVGMLYERRHSREVSSFGGLWKVLPVFTGLALVITFSSMGLPGLNGFVGEFTILLGAMGSSVLGFWFVLFGTLGVIMAAIYLLYMWNKVFMGEVNVPEAHGHGDAHHSEAPHTPEASLEPALAVAGASVGHAETTSHGSSHDSHGGHDSHSADAHGGHGGDGDEHAIAEARKTYYPLTWNETLALILVVVAALVIGLYPRPNFQAMDATVNKLSDQLRPFMPVVAPAEGETAPPAVGGEQGDDHSAATPAAEGTQPAEGESTPAAEGTAPAGGN